MRIALIADIHGNLAALDTVLDEIERAGVDRIICLGDVAATGPQPLEVLARLREVGCPVVMGNADTELLEPGPEPEPGTDAARFAEIGRWAAAQLSPEDTAFIRSFQPTIAVPLEPTGELLCVHGSPRSFNDIVVATTPETEVAEMLGDLRPALVVGGHTHIPMLRRYHETVLANPGSVGLAYRETADGKITVPTYAEFALLTATAENQSLSFRRTSYDQAATIRAMYEHEMPFADWWSEGWQWKLERV